MIRETHNYALRYVTETEAELLDNVVYESITNTPFNGVGFDTEAERTQFMKVNNLTVHEPETEIFN